MSSDLILWRISNYRTLEGAGGLDFAGRWHRAGRPVVYLADAPGGALLETLVHLQIDEQDLPTTFQLLRVIAPANVKITTLEPVGPSWRDDVEQTQAQGTRWLSSCQACLLSVPSAVIPRSRNYLLNPLHPDANRVSIAEVIDERYDPRLFKIRKL